MARQFQTYLRAAIISIFCWCFYGAPTLAGNASIKLQDIFAKANYIGLHTAGKEFYLSDDEKYTIALINLARYNPKAFIQEIIVSGGLDTATADMRDLLKHLQKHKSTFPLMPAFSLYKSAVVHAKDQGLSGKTGHVGSDGKTYQQRIQQYFSAPAAFHENYYTGSGDPVDVVIKMLCSNSEGSTLYRDNLLSSNVHYIGISIQPHRTRCTNAVIDFAQKPFVAASEKRQKKDNMEVYWKDCPTGTKVSSRRKSGSFSFMGLFGGRK